MEQSSQSKKFSEWSNLILLPEIRAKFFTPEYALFVKQNAGDAIRKFQIESDLAMRWMASVFWNKRALPTGRPNFPEAGIYETLAESSRVIDALSNPLSAFEDKIKEIQPFYAILPEAILAQVIQCPVSLYGVLATCSTVNLFWAAELQAFGESDRNNIIFFLDMDGIELGVDGLKIKRPEKNLVIENFKL